MTVVSCSSSAKDSRQIYAVPVQAGESVVAGRADMLFEFAMPTAAGGATLRRRARWTVRDDPQRRDGRRRRRGVDPGPDPNWFEELKRLVPTN